MEKVKRKYMNQNIEKRLLGKYEYRKDIREDILKKVYSMSPEDAVIVVAELYLKLKKVYGKFVDETIDVINKVI